MIDGFHFDYQSISKQYGKNIVLDEVSISIHDGDCLLITGENGSGKTTLLRILAGIEKPNRFGISIDQAETRSWRACRARLLQSIMYLHQQPYMLAGTLQRNLEYTAKLNPAIIDKAKSVSQVLHWAGLESLAMQQAVSLSGGQQQRVALSRTRLRNPQILLLDEPTANLDSDSRSKTLRMLEEFLGNGMAIVIATHAPDFFSSLQGRELKLVRHRLQADNVEPGKVADLKTYQQTRSK
ncbi:MAG: ATP-binding cassette domain-containing protein [Proteobacteria bacterium]|nr:ATP-binding cassette domain-containing protein [Pseudomonadota bacterium]MCH8176849.1 ATP-binding cassette domain-containing protein [Pseudomonadota bacterium]